ncbi:MAG: CHRD domain-containing protein [Bacteroidia bacterium]
MDTSGLSGRFEAASNILTARTGQIDTLLRRLMYVNIHTVNNTPGEIRGSVLPLAATYFTSHAKADNQLNTVSSPASGSMNATLTGNSLVVTGSF